MSDQAGDPYRAEQWDRPWPGSWHPLGAHHDGQGVNFALWAAGAEAVELCLFDDSGDEHRVPLAESTFHIWHSHLPGIQPGQRYGFRVHGPWDPARGRRWNADKLLLDPYARALEGDFVLDDAVYAHAKHGSTANSHARDDRDSAPHVPHGIVIGQVDVDTGLRPHTPWAETIIYELHLRGFTMRHPAVPEELRGTYAGLAHPAVIDHLVHLGVTAVELLPIHHFVSEPHLLERGLSNYWGYNSIAYFAPHAPYSAAARRGERGAQVREFKEMVAALHAAGIEVILDVVYNHTAEGGGDGPTLCFRGIDNESYYRLDEKNPSRYADYTGCGNTLNVVQPHVLQLITDSLRYWVTEMGVDGFRFDLASALARSFHDVDKLSAFLTVIAQDPVLQQVKLIAEPWDVGEGGYQVGEFPPLWTEWNDKFRDTVRDFWRGARTDVRDLAYRLSGSSDLYQDDGRRPYASINFVTAHDGFTMRDLVTYNHKHNEAHGENNRDGTNDNRSSNYGVEGESDDEAVNQLRRRQIRNLMTTLVLSTGVPMITAGDEFGRTQGGDNNAYCMDNEVGWVDWSLLDKGEWSSLLDLTRRLIHLRKRHPVLRQRVFFSGQPAHPGGLQDIAWFRPDGEEMTDGDWFAPASGLGVYLSGQDIRGRGPHGERITDDSFLLLVHAGTEELPFVLPGDPWARWYHTVIDTTLEGDPGARDNVTFGGGLEVDLAPRSLLLLRADPESWSAT
ncbi:glycogen debranching protein GlgX [Actinocrinis puniceicyclus]|uniref:Glycogen debranching protein GlgX n=1 Tax=Actinocrinis puniceicyclus TaxID=977794 RepID=A0A8J7WL88_9ACTN|nr:glycogen debranching protein GlgX [Actinocrinis puniceicyclus]MBS2961844.1 glycogen debranching protein GlgX [Actinocrinis puniceicyclus]